MIPTETPQKHNLIAIIFSQKQIKVEASMMKSRSQYDANHCGDPNCSRWALEDPNHQYHLHGTSSYISVSVLLRNSLVNERV